MRKSFFALMVLGGFFLSSPSSASYQEMEDLVGEVAGAAAGMVEEFVDDTVEIVNTAFEEIAQFLGFGDEDALVEAAFSVVGWPVDITKGKSLSFSGEEEIVLRDSYGRLPGNSNYRFPVNDVDAENFKRSFVRGAVGESASATFTSIEENVVVDVFGRLPDHPYYRFFGTDAQATAFLG
ncbi:MAG: hypothetical protein GY915_04165 [bacterium]|nr:hypothetical protein [bacterium]